jgi:hypothetical protein
MREGVETMKAVVFKGKNVCHSAQAGKCAARYRRGQGGLLVVGGFGFAYGTGRMSVGRLALLGTLMLALGVITVTFVRKVTRPDVSTEQMLYKTDHPTQT